MKPSIQRFETEREQPNPTHSYYRYFLHLYDCCKEPLCWYACWNPRIVKKIIIILAAILYVK